MSFSMFAGNARKLVVSVIDDETNEPKDLTDVEMRWQAARGNAEKFSSVPVLTKTIGNGITVTSEFDGTLEITLDTDDTNTLPPGVYYHELLLVDVTGDEENLIADTFTVKRRLVHPEAL